MIGIESAEVALATNFQKAAEPGSMILVALVLAAGFHWKTVVVWIESARVALMVSLATVASEFAKFSVAKAPLAVALEPVGWM